MNRVVAGSASSAPSAPDRPAQQRARNEARSPSAPAATTAMPAAAGPLHEPHHEPPTSAGDMPGSPPPPEQYTKIAAPPDRPRPSRTPSDDNEHDTLKYHLLGPSLTKAGQDAVDQQKVSEIIYNASKGSKFFNNEEVKDKNLTEKIARILTKRQQLEKLDLSSDLRRADDYIAELELSRDLSQVVVHIDCDAFYAAVEELDRPELRQVPMAVGKGVLTTCNYHARKFGCRSGMAGFVAMKLCPQLICLPMNFAKYTAKAEEVRTVLAEYDPCFESASCDEAYLNLTQYCTEHDMTPEEAVSQLRAEVHERTKITVSAGIGANAKLAKICSNKNKPNGQYLLPRDRQTIMAFMKTLPTRKVNGIGRVFERELDAIGVKTCGDIYAHRAYLPRLFGQKAFQFLMQCYLGLGRTRIQRAEDHERKSVGTESTFRELGTPDALREKLRHIAEELDGDLKRTGFKGRTLCLKIKLHTYEVYTRQTTPPFAVHLADDLYKYSLPMLEKLMREMPGMKLRLMGLRVTHIISTKKGGIDFFGRFRVASTSSTATPRPQSTENTAAKDNPTDDNWPDMDPANPEVEFEEAALRERNAEFNELEKLSQEHDNQNSHNNTTPEEGATKDEEEPALWTCPICSLPQPPDDSTFNSHIDFCLSRQTIREAVKDTTGLPEKGNGKRSTRPQSSNSSSSGHTRGGRGRGRGGLKRRNAESEAAAAAAAATKRRLMFFGGVSRERGR